MMKVVFVPLVILLAVIEATPSASSLKPEVAQEFLQEGFNFLGMALYLYVMTAVELLISGLLLAGMVAGTIFFILWQVKTRGEKFFQEGFNFPQRALYLYMMGLLGFMLSGVSIAGIVAGIIIYAIILILWLKRRKPATDKNASASPSSSDSTDASVQEDKPKVCRSRCWCCLNCLDCQQRRPPGFEPFPKRPKRKYTISERERQRRRRRMKTRWAQDRQGMLKKIREGIWRWLLDMEPCGCWCCDNCLRCQVELKYKATESKSKTREKRQMKAKKVQKQKKRGSKSQIKSPQSKNNPTQTPGNLSRPSQKANKTQAQKPKSTVGSPFLGRILEVMKKWKDAISKIFKKLWKGLGLIPNKISKSLRKTKKIRAKRLKYTGNRKNSSLFIKILEFMKRCKDTVLKGLKKLGAWIGLHKQKTITRNKSPPC